MIASNARRAPFRAALVAACALASACSTYGQVSLPRAVQPGTKGLVASPSSLSMGPGDAGTVSASENGYSGSFSSTDNCAGIATVTQQGPSSFTITAVAPGLCTVTIADSSGHTANVGISVQQTVIGGH